MCEKYVAVPADKTPKYIIRMAKISRCYDRIYDKLMLT
jgi:hypothetical protein